MRGNGDDVEGGTEEAIEEATATDNIAVAESTTTTPPSKAAGSKPSTSAIATPARQSVRNKHSPPTSKGSRNPRTPTCKSKKQNANNLKKVKKLAPKASDNATVARAASLFNRTTKSTTITINNTMWLFLSECERYVLSREVVFLHVPVNHTSVNDKAAHETTNNILDNPVHADLSKKFHEPNMGTDMHCLMRYNEKVCLCTLLPPPHLV